MSSKRAPAWMRPAPAPFKPDAAKERMLWWRKHRPELWETLSPTMRADVERYEPAKQAASEGGT